MRNKNLSPKNTKPVVRKSSISLPELHEEQLTGGISDNSAITPTSLHFKEMCFCSCSFEGDGDDA